MLAAQTKKPIYIYYIPTLTESELYKTNQWYVIGMAEKLNPGNVHVKKVNDISDLLDELYNDFKIQALRYPEKRRTK